MNWVVSRYGVLIGKYASQKKSRASLSSEHLWSGYHDVMPLALQVVSGIKEAEPHLIKQLLDLDFT